MRDHDISQRRACRLVGVDPRTVRRERPPERAIEGAIGSSPMASPEIREEMKDIAGKRRRFGYRRIGVLLERKGMIMNHKKLYRLYREDGGGSENSPGDCFPADTVGEATTRAQAGPRHTHADAAGWRAGHDHQRQLRPPPPRPSGAYPGSRPSSPRGVCASARTPSCAARPDRARAGRPTAPWPRSRTGRSRRAGRRRTASATRRWCRRSR